MNCTGGSKPTLQAPDTIRAAVWPAVYLRGYLEEPVLHLFVYSSLLKYMRQIQASWALLFSLMSSQVYRWSGVHTHTHTYAHTHTHIHIHTNTHIHTQAHNASLLPPTYQHTHTNKHTQTHTCSLLITLTLMVINVRLHATEAHHAPLCSVGTCGNEVAKGEAGMWGAVCCLMTLNRIVFIEVQAPDKTQW